jgi:hypothetical protein
MRKFLLSTLFVFATLASVSIAYATSDAAIRNRLKLDYGLFSTYMAAHNIDGIASLTAPDYTVYSPDQPLVTRTAMLADFKQQMFLMKGIVWKRTIKTFAREGGRVVVLVNGHLTAQTADRAGKLHAFVLNAVSSDTWVQVSGKWEIEHSKVFMVDALMDGHPAPGH